MSVRCRWRPNTLNIVNRSINFIICSMYQLFLGIMYLRNKKGLERTSKTMIHLQPLIDIDDQNQKGAVFTYKASHTDYSYVHPPSQKKLKIRWQKRMINELLLNRS